MGIQIARAAVLLLAAALRLGRLNQNGYDNEYYAAAVRSMASGWHAFLYNAFDPTGFVSVDKPPVALWLQALAVKLFGFHGLTVLLPQVAEGVAAVALLDYLVRRRLGARAGVLAGLFLAVMPVSVATDRSNNTESCLVLVLLLAAWALLAAAERGSRWLLLPSGVLISLGFTTSCSWRRPWPRGQRRRHHRVDPALWRAGVSSDDESGGSSTRREARAASGLELYGLKRGAELIPARTDR